MLPMVTVSLFSVRFTAPYNQPNPKLTDRINFGMFLLKTITENALITPKLQVCIQRKVQTTKLTRLYGKATMIHRFKTKNVSS